MSTSKLYSDESSSSVESELDDIDDYELKVEQFDVGSISVSNEASEKSSKDSYSDEPIVDKE